MIHILLIDDCYPINTRNRKILTSLAEHYGEQAEFSVITWDRNNDYQQALPGYHVYSKVSAYGNKTRKLLNLWGYRKFCHDTIRRLNPDVVIASHWNNLLMVPRLDRSRQMLIYEDLDVPTEAYIFRKASSILEHWKMRQADLTIHASRFFTELYSPKHRQIVLENKPIVHVEPSTQPYTLHNPIRIAFIGLLRYREILALLIDAVRDDSRFELFFHGDGHARQYLEDYAGNAQNIHFTGRYDFEDVGRLYQQTDIVWAAYPNKDFNVKYAISNKFHESLVYGIPTVYANNTRLGDFVSHEGIGMTVDPYSTDNINAFLEHIASNTLELDQIAQNIHSFFLQQTTWNEDFVKITEEIDKFLDKKNSDDSIIESHLLRYI